MNLTKKIMVFILVIFKCMNITNSKSATINAASTSYSDVQSAINLAMNGDIIIVPAGSSKWTNTVIIPNSKGISLIGAGIDKTFIEDGTGVDGDNSNTALYIYNSENRPFRISGFTFTDGNNADWKGVIGMEGTCKNFRIDHCKFESLGHRAIFGSGDMWGLIDHCQFLNGAQQVINFNSCGDEEWNRPLSLGTEQAVYIEDCLFSKQGAPYGIIDAHNGGRFVIRHNKVINHHVSTHHADMEIGYRGVHSYEIYENEWIADGNEIWSTLTLRGGTGVLYNNTFNTSNGGAFSHIINLVNYCINDRSCVERHTIYPALDQIGRTTGQVLSPLYEWNNTSDGIDIDCDTFFSADLNDCGNCDSTPCAGCGSSPCTPCFIRENRDYYNDRVKPEYKAYTHPHPLSLPIPPEDFNFVK